MIKTIYPLQLDESPVLTEDERELLLANWNQTKADYPQDKTINQLFEEQVTRTPDNIAVVSQEQSLTFRELNQRSNQLASYLRSQGVKPDS